MKLLTHLRSLEALQEYLQTFLKTPSIDVNHYQWFAVCANTLYYPESFHLARRKQAADLALIPFQTLLACPKNWLTSEFFESCSVIYSSHDHTVVFFVSLQKDFNTVEMLASENAFVSTSIKLLLLSFDERTFGWFSALLQLHRWQQIYRYCPRCASILTLNPSDNALTCSACNIMHYPTLSPCVLMLVHRRNEILLATGAGRPVGFFSVLAGFMEVGETAEQAVHREIMEEVGLYVREPRYQCSQSWPFPHAVMFGFLAEYAHGDIQVDPIEIAQAKWFHVDEIVALQASGELDLPPHGTLSRRLIDMFVPS